MPPSTAAIVDCWDRLHDRGPLDRATGLIALFHPDEPHATIEDWPIGRRDAALLRARAALLGEAIRAVAACPRCGTVAELTFTADQVAARPAPARTEYPLGARRVTLRPITTRDLRAALAAPAPRLALAQACADGAAIGEEEVGAIAALLQTLDPQADIQLSLRCDDCKEAWTAPFDVPTYVWTELAAWTRRRLREVHQLASAYGWSERDILALSPARRGVYLAMCDA